MSDQHCERCRVEITSDNADSTRVFTRFTETTKRLRYGMSVVFYWPTHLDVLTSQFKFCRDCGDAWCDFLQGKPTEGIQHA